MKKVLDAMLAALARGERVTLCSVLASSGSAPRGAGAKMAVFEDGSTRGTIGGGAVEQLCTQRALKAMKSGENELSSYELHPNDVSDIGMICGGRVTVYFQLFSPQAAADIAVLRRWREKLDESVDLWLLLSLEGERVRNFRVLTRGELPQERREDFTTRALWRDGLYIEPLERAGKTYIFGGGHVGRALVPVLASVGFRVTMYDDRAALAKPERYPGADEVICGSIGSRSKVAKTRERLLSDGFDEREIARIHAPIGLPILAETPEEIAVSVAAEMIEHRARRAGVKK